MSVSRRIIVEEIFPPIPLRSFDFMAVYEGDESDGTYTVQGWGATADAARQALLDNTDDE
jgi:hypothetical protein